VKFVSNFLLALLVITLLQCKNSDKNYSGSAGKAALTVTDFNGSVVSLPHKPSRIICLIESALSGVFMLRSQHKVIAISTNVYQGTVFPHYALLDERIRNKTLPTPGNWDFINIESIVALNPDLVIIWASQNEAIENIKKHGIPVYGVMLKSVADIYKEIADLGRLLNAEKRADSILQYTRKEIELLQLHKNPIPVRSIYFMWAQGFYETSGKSSTVNELIELAGCVNAVKASEEHLVVNAEKLYDWNPDMIVLWYNEKLDPDDVMSEPSFKGISAVKNSAVIELPSVFYCDLWTLKFLYAVKLLAKRAYPDVYKFVDLAAEKKKMMKILYGENIEIIQ